MTEPHVAVLSQSNSFSIVNTVFILMVVRAPHKVKNDWRSLIRPPGKKLRLLLMPTKRM